jgi:hypothetical protein
MEDKADAHHVHGHSSRGSTPAAVRDPVCGMDVVPGDAPGGSALHGVRSSSWNARATT